MSMNAHHCCIVFSNSDIRARQKLEEISSTATNVEKKITRGSLIFIIDDDEWIWVRPTELTRGYRPHKAWVDKNCTLEQHDNIILPACSYCQEIRYF